MCIVKSFWLQDTANFSLSRLIVSDIYGYLTNLPKCYGLKQQQFVTFHDSEVLLIPMANIWFLSPQRILLFHVV